MKLALLLGGLLIAVLVIGFLVPMGSYATQNGCITGSIPTIRQSFIRGQTLQKQKDADTHRDPAAGCAIQAVYVQYLF